MESKNNNGKKKKWAMIATGAGLGFVSAAATAVAPLTGGASLAVAAVSTKAAIGYCALAAGIGAGAGAVTAKVTDSKKINKAYNDGMSDASIAYEQKFKDQEKKMNERVDEFEATCEQWKKNQEEMNKVLQECLAYIKELEEARDILHSQGKDFNANQLALYEKLQNISKSCK